MVKTYSDEKERLIDEKTENPDIKENVSSQNASKWEPNVVKSIRDTRWRWFALALISFMTFGSYFFSDSLNSLSDLIYRKVTHEADAKHKFKYNQLYSIIYYPNIVLPLIGGILIDRIGLYVTIVIVSVLLATGQAVFMVAGFMGTDDETNNWPFIVAITGRFIYGLGGDILGVCQSTFVTKWFMGKELSLALGIVLSISWCGQSASSYTVPPLAESTSLGFGLMLGVIVLLISFTFSLTMIVYYYTVDKIEKNDEKIRIDDEYKFHWRDLRQLNRIYWAIIFNCVFTYSGMMFYNFSNDFFQTRYGFDQIEAARINNNCYLVCMFLALMFNYMFDFFDIRVTFSVMSTTFLTLYNELYIVISSSIRWYKIFKLLWL